MQRQQGQGYVNISKKANIIKEDDNKKKGKKNKKDEWQDVRQFQKMEANIQEKKMEPPGKNASEEEKDRIFMQMCEIFPHHQPSDILKCLRKHRYDMQETINHLADQPEKTEKISQKQEKTQREEDNAEIAHQLLSQVYEQFEKENISSEEFQQIFEEIAEMFREKQSETQEVSSFVDQCKSMKAALLIAFQKELANYDDFQFDLQSPLWLQTQEFKLQTNEKIHKAAKTIDKDFPAVTDNCSNAEEESNFYKTLKQEKKKQQQLVFFTPPKNNMPQFSQKNPKNSIFNLDNKRSTQDSLSSLHKKFGNIPIPWLKFVYRQLQGDFNQCCEFFWKYYKEMCEEKVIPVRKQVSSQPQPRPRVISNVGSGNAVRKEEVDEDVRHRTLRQIRTQLDYLYKLRQTMQDMRGKVKSGNHRLDLQRMINQQNPRINKLSRAARILEIERMAGGDPLFIDLHGYRKEQISPLFDSIFLMLNQNKWSERVKAREIDGILMATFVAMTGKALHSWGNRSVLKPAVQSWCVRNNCKSTQESDRIRILIPLK